MKLNKLISASDVIINEIRECKDHDQIDCLDSQIKQFKTTFMNIAKTKIDENLIQTYVEFHYSLLDYYKMKIKHTKSLK